MVHSDDTEPLYLCGQEASEDIPTFSEDGNPMLLIQYYRDLEGVESVHNLCCAWRLH